MVSAPYAWTCCEVCKFLDGEEWMLLCDACWKGWHMYCLTAPLTDTPEGCWVCPTCVGEGITTEAVEARSLLNVRQPLESQKDLQAHQGSLVMT